MRGSLTSSFAGPRSGSRNITYMRAHATYVLGVPDSSYATSKKGYTQERLVDKPCPARMIAWRYLGGPHILCSSTALEQ